jgi:hypothetical protein
MSIPLGDSGKPQDSLYLKTPVTPEEAFQAIGRLRKEARDEIDRLIRFLDKTDDYVCRELEQEDGNDEPEGHDEPSLGSFDRMTDQDKSWRTFDRNPDLYGYSHGVDNEEDHCDHEPSLGSLDGRDDQAAWAAGDSRDLEKDPAESGIGDHDGLGEQVGSQDWQQGAMA